MKKRLGKAPTLPEAESDEEAHHRSAIYRRLTLWLLRTLYLMRFGTPSRTKKRKMPNFFWDNRTLRYRGQGGRFVKRSAITSALDKAIDETKNRIVGISGQLQRGEINLSDWTLQMRDAIKAQHTLSAGIARGGKLQMSPAEWSRVGNQVKPQYQYLQKFAREIANGLPLNGRFLQRAQLYATAARGTYSEAERRLHRDAGFDEERNVLGASEHCGGCAEESAKGWVKIGTLAPVGSRDCRANDRCEITYRKAA